MRRSETSPRHSGFGRYARHPQNNQKVLSSGILFFITLLLSMGCTVIAFWCQPNALQVILSNCIQRPLLFILNFLPVLLLLTLCGSLLGNIFYGAALTNMITGILSIVNRLKIEIRDEPLFLRDFGLLKEAGSAAGTYQLHFPGLIILAVVSFSVTLALIGTKTGHFLTPKNQNIENFTSSPNLRREWLYRITGAVISAAVFLTLTVTIYASDDLYNSFPVSVAYYMPMMFNDRGFPYSFVHHMTTYSVEKPEGFSREEAENWETEFLHTGNGGGAAGNTESHTETDRSEVNIIMVMNESFSDVTDNPVFLWDHSESGTGNPLRHFHALADEPHAITGYLIIPGFAGGTANTEFDVLTGIQTNALSPTTTSAFRVVNREIDSLFRVFRAGGYAAEFCHPGDNWFYNRRNVYDWMGVSDSVFVEEMEDTQKKGRWVTDDWLAGFLEERFTEKVIEQGEKLFCFTTTIQNHMSYTADKYGAGYDFPEVRTSAGITPETQTVLQVYSEGVRDADAMLGRLTDFFRGSEEPVIVVFFGDHLPYLGDAYRELGMSDYESDYFWEYRTPYIIWANPAAATDWEERITALELPENHTLSAAFFGAALLELSGRDTDSAWFHNLNALRREMPVIQRQTGLDRTGQIVSLASCPDSIQESIARWRKWSYYKLRYQTFPHQTDTLTISC